MSATFGTGAVVTNGHWVGNVLAVHGDYAWVQPAQYVRRGPKGEVLPYDFKDGPLTFRTRDLYPALEIAA
ncbi:MAG: hypothetical protein ACK4FB_07935 [Brevundimonas sp.]|uniref:hypothetical protein n=1 Tax=Brevundimonas sp. TaxID=1871086 RepID=UPI003919A9A5